MAIHPMTQAFWREVMGNNPSLFVGDDLPVEQVFWDDCQGFLRKLNERDGRACRLLTEAEWEYACRAGTTTSIFFWQDDFNSPSELQRQARRLWKWKERSLSRTDHASDGKFSAEMPGAFTYMHGNVWEWCSDWHGRYPPGEAVDPQGPNNDLETEIAIESCVVARITSCRHTLAVPTVSDMFSRTATTMSASARS